MSLNLRRSCSAKSSLFSCKKESGIATTTKSEWWRMWGAGALIAMLVGSALPCP